MNQAIIITPHVINTLKSLPERERSAITAALAEEMILGGCHSPLSPYQRMLYSIIRFYVERDTMKYNGGRCYD